MSKPKSGDTVRVKANKEVLEGILMSNEYSDSVIIKLNTGYNVGIHKKRYYFYFCH